MQEELRIVFMGTPDFAVTILDSLLKAGQNVVGVITAPDKPAGRGRKLNQSAVKKYALENELNILQPTNLKNEDFLKELEELNANLQIIVAFRMLPEVVWRMPKYGTFNLHASLLPNYRGAAPINWAIINGETKTGVTTFFIDEKIDTGEIILSEEMVIEETDNAGSLHDKLMHLGSEVVLKTVNLIKEGNVNRLPQPEVEGIRTAYKIHRETCKINWRDDITDIHNLIRGLNPYPGAWSSLEDGDEILEMKIYETEKIVESHQHEVGKIITTKKTMLVAVKDGFISLLSVKLQGKRKMDIVSLLNGLKLTEEAKMS